MSGAVMGTEATPVEVTVRYSNTRYQNLKSVQEQLIEAGLIAQADQFLAEYRRMTEAFLRRELADHPISAAVEAVGVKVRWVA